MKNILKKLGIFTLLLSVLLPFMELPVKAASGNCEYYLQNYLFLDHKGAAMSWSPYIGNGNRTFTSFLYDFPDITDSQTLKIESVEVNDLETKDEIAAYYKYFNKLYESDILEEKENLHQYGNFIYSDLDDSEIKQITYLLHGKWASYDQNGNAQLGIYTDKNGILSNNTNENAIKFLNSTFQGMLINGGQENYIGVLRNNIGGATLLNNVYGVATDSKYASTSGLVNYFQKIVDDVTSENKGSDSAWNKNYVWSDEEEGKIYLNLTVNRSVSGLDGIIFGRTVDNVLYVFSTSNNVVENSYDAYNTWINAINSGNGYNFNSKCGTGSGEISGCYWIKADGAKDKSGKSVSVSIDTKNDHGIYMPLILGVKYSVCSNEKWTLNYDANTDDLTVSNVPAAQTAATTESITVSSGPNSDNLKFENWCVEKDGSGNCFNPSDKVTHTQVPNGILYAQWSKKGTTDNKDTGIATYLLCFVGVGTIACGIYLTTRKRNLFKQI